jgi:hypothetical protein
VNTRTYDEIMEEMSTVIYDPPDSVELGSPEAALLHAEYCERHAKLWGEIARMASRDGSPGWATLAVALLRDRLSSEARDARADAGRRKPR